MKKMVLATAVGTMMLGGFTPIPLSNPTVRQVEAATISYVKPQDVEVSWISGDIVYDDGSVSKDATKSSQFTTKTSEKGTLIIELKKKEYRYMEMYRDPQASEWLPAFLYVQPYGFDGRDQYAKKVTGIQKSDFINRDSVENFTIRQVYYIEQPKADKKYYLGGVGTSSPNSYYIDAKFYPNVDLTKISKAERSAYIKTAQKGDEIPASNVSHIGRVLIQANDMVLYNKDGKVHRKLKQYEGLRVYQVQGDRYQVGGGFYVKKTKNTLFYVGHIYGKDQHLSVYKPNGEFFKKFKPMENVRVYSTENGRYNVGAGYYALPDFHVNFDR
ncbi:hypothetical protein [Metabacillus fastidiosus]|uniref:Uncharacterized protein n=2 Tax=Metabacillus fastidiosus TaxID=1458 RepID=A0ABU6NT64_9BACI|nr:hypothetical protein [Metabacillus fastidiosus]